MGKITSNEEVLRRRLFCEEISQDPKEQRSYLLANDEGPFLGVDLRTICAK
jgi:hypothetical protein